MPSTAAKTVAVKKEAMLRNPPSARCASTSPVNGGGKTSSTLCVTDSSVRGRGIVATSGALRQCNRPALFQQGLHLGLVHALHELIDQGRERHGRLGVLCQIERH